MNRFFIKNSNIVLKEIFKNEENLYILKDFIEEILDIEILKILQKNVLEKNINLNIDNFKEISNLLILTKTKEKINIGVQIIDGKYIQEKILIYGALIHGIQESTEDSNESIKTITINILDTSYFSNSEYIRKIDFVNDEIMFCIIELPKFKKSKIESKKDAWISFLKFEDIDIVEKAKREYTIINDFDCILDKYWKNEKL